MEIDDQSENGVSGTGLILSAITLTLMFVLVVVELVRSNLLADLLPRP